jgi:hypothetical protein
MPGLIKHKVVRNEHLVGDRVEFESWSRTVPYKRQYTSREFAVSIRIETWSEEFKEASEYVTKSKMLNGPEVANIVMGFHQALVRAGWRPYQEQRTYGSYALPQDAHVGSGDGWGQVDGFYKDHFYALDPSVDELHFWRLGNMGRGYYLPEFSQANPPVAPSTEVHEPQRKRFWRKN